MNYENRVPDETVNYSEEHPLKEFAWLVIGATTAVVVTIAAVGYFAAELAARLPYAVERELVAERVSPPSKADDPAQDKAALALRELGARVEAAMSLEPGMAIRFHLVDSEMVNAFATLGGQVFVNRGLIARMPDENTLALVIAHEIAHVKLRHPVRAAGRGVAIGVLLTAVGFSGSSGGDLTNLVGGVTLLTFSRSQERDADREALAAVNKLYGHAGGPKELFTMLGAEGGSDSMRLAMLQTHPLSSDRVSELLDYATAQHWPVDGTRRPLSAALAALKSKQK
ncbi:M48 family metallopeptidase [Usitatibacter palustris]|uniref:Beta-barrel assembly-enhancing protease n=1 Tax=Usitatibacter palustris TaxID=2732487 RepID=A0A6M4H758_9PROT|nr:M48 family metallopeptidase [Usitatibacter palustris]QJR14758.1 Beta-barrel assembly-enhancing protease [Usitatibacter palustris]